MHREQDHLLVQHLVVLEMMEQHHRRALRVRRHEHRGAAHAHGLAEPRRSRGTGPGQARLAQHLLHLGAPALPGGEHRRTRAAATSEREPAAVLDLDDVGREEAEVDGQEEDEERQRAPARPVPAAARAITVKRIVVIAIVPVTAMPYAAARFGGGAEAEHEREAADRRAPVHLGDVDLARSRAGGVHDLEARRIAELHRLLRERERAGDERLRRDDRGDGRERDHRVEQRHAGTRR